MRSSEREGLARRAAYQLRQQDNVAWLSDAQIAARLGIDESAVHDIVERLDQRWPLLGGWSAEARDDAHQSLHGDTGPNGR